MARRCRFAAFFSYRTTTATALSLFCKELDTYPYNGAENDYPDYGILYNQIRRHFFFLFVPVESEAFIRWPELSRNTLIITLFTNSFICPTNSDAS